jgi:hypothetical protein
MITTSHLVLHILKGSTTFPIEFGCRPRVSLVCHPSISRYCASEVARPAIEYTSQRQGQLPLILRAQKSMHVNVSHCESIRWCPCHIFRPNPSAMSYQQRGMLWRVTQLKVQYYIMVREIVLLLERLLVKSNRTSGCCPPNRAGSP